MLTQADIDRQQEPEPDKFLKWVEGTPGLIFTLVLLATIIAGLWGLWQLWQMVSPMATTIKG